MASWPEGKLESGDAGEKVELRSAQGVANKGAVPVGGHYIDNPIPAQGTHIKGALSKNGKAGNELPLSVVKPDFLGFLRIGAYVKMIPAQVDFRGMAYGFGKTGLEGVLRMLDQKFPPVAEKMVTSEVTVLICREGGF